MLRVSNKAEFLAALERLTSEGALLPNEEMVRAFSSLEGANFTMPELKTIVDFAVEQIGQWQARWLFSSAQAPDIGAEAEADEWERVWDGFSTELMENVSGLEELLRRGKDLVVAKRLLERKLELDGGSRIRRFASWAMGGLAIALHRLGCGGIAQDIYKKALFPSGTVGRLKGA